MNENRIPVGILGATGSEERIPKSQLVEAVQIYQRIVKQLL